MRAVGIVRKVDNLGRVVVPKEIRKAFEMDNNDLVEIYTDKDSVILKKYCPECVFCGKVDYVHQFEGKNICSACMEAIADEINKH